METRSQKMLICECCQGEGTVENSRLVDPHKGEYDYWDTVCQNCKGSGRMLKTVTTITEIVPYDNPEVTLLLLKDQNGKT